MRAAEEEAEEEEGQTAAAHVLCASGAEPIAPTAPIAPIAFKTASVLTPSGLLDGLNPTVSSPFYGIEGWTVHFDKG